MNLNTNDNTDAVQKNLFRVAKLLAASSDKTVRASGTKVSVERLDAALAGMDVEQRMFIKCELARAGVIS